MIENKNEYIMVDDEEYLEDEEFYGAKNIYSRNGTDHLLENDEISAEEEAFMNGWDEADTMEQ